MVPTIPLGPIFAVETNELIYDKLAPAAVADKVLKHIVDNHIEELHKAPLDVAVKV